MSLPGSGRRKIRGRKVESPTAPTPGRGALRLTLAGAALAAAAVYLCRYTYVHDLAPDSVATVAAGLGLLGAFCVLTAAVVIGIRQIIVKPGARFQPAAALAIALVFLAALVGLVILGVSLL